MGSDRVCARCGVQGGVGDAFCRRCGALVDGPPAPPQRIPAPPPTAPPSVTPTMRTVARIYGSVQARDLDSGRMMQYGWNIIQTAPQGTQWTVTYGTAAPPGMATLPDQLVERKAGSNRPILAIIGGVCLLFLCVILAQVFNSDSSSATNEGGDGTSSKPAPNSQLASMVDPRRLESNPGEYKGSNVYVQGKALTVTQHGDHTWVQILARVPGKDYDTVSVVIELRPKHTLLSGECYRVYGVGRGTQKVTRSLTGTSNESPLLGGYFAEESPSGRYGDCAAPR